MKDGTAELIKIRHILHKNPELSEKEENTSKFIFDKIKRFEPD